MNDYEQHRKWITNMSRCHTCDCVIDAAGQCDCDYDPLWWDTPNRRRLPLNTKANVRAQKKHNAELKRLQEERES